ncbi:MAG TPA: sigma-54 dependent transcriptional regulator, partial [Terriglobales bacterium]|nr:sigma-54 dependent transcriptional regulator [Terriglobales bacterium]
MNDAAINSVLVVDDEPGMRMALMTNFQREGWRVETASGASEALRKFHADRFPLVVTDIRMPGGDGLQLMRSVRSANPATAVIVLTAFGSVPEAVQAIQGGACDYLTKPISFEQLRSSVSRVMEQVNHLSEFSGCRRGAIVGTAASLLKALDRARHAARANADVLIEAESGTGKELLARFIHDNSPRHSGPFVAVNCAAVPEHLLESELFGHMRGAFTGAATAKAGKFELAQEGTLLLDEIGEMPINLQPKLLRVLQERQVERLGGTRPTAVNIRVVATTNVSLRQMVQEGKFRADLYYRL